MSKGSINFGIRELGKELSKIEEIEEVYIETHDYNLLEAIGLLSYFKNCHKITLIINISTFKEQGVTRQSDRLKLLDYMVSQGINNTTLDSNIVIGIRHIYNSGNIDIYINDKEGHGESVVILKDRSITHTLVSNRQNEFETVSTINWLKDEEGSESLLQVILEDLKASGRPITSNLISILVKNIKIDEETPLNFYNKALYELNKHYISNNPVDEALSIMQKAELKFQSDGVNALISIIQKYGIAYLADSVGLGKTIIALRFLVKTGYNAIVVTPNDIVKAQWEEYIREFKDRTSIQNSIHLCINSYQSMNDTAKLVDKYDIVIFDEAHNFRNTKTLRYIKAQELCSGKHVLLIGATPINNSIQDIEAQLKLGLNPYMAYDFGVGILEDYFNTLNKEVPNSKKDPNKYMKAQKVVGKKIRNSIISKLMVRRTRQDIEKYYEEDLKSGIIHFPTIEKPVIIRYKYNGTKLAKTLDILSGYNFSNQLTFAIYNKQRYKKGLTEEELEDIQEWNFTGLNKVRLIKLLDSSVEAFVTSLIKMQDTIDAELDRVTHIIRTQENSQFSLFGVDKEESDEYTEKYIDDLENDLRVINTILDMWFDGTQFIDTDIKPKALVEVLDKHKGEKVVIFTEYIQTAIHLADYLSKTGYKVLKIDGSDKKFKTQELKDNFSISGANLDNYDILVSTNILSEGINLNRASVAINYDITWNPTIITQRVGRLNRVDSTVKSIKIYNFFPCDEMDTAILSESNIVSKFALANFSIGSDENYLLEDNISDSESMMEYKHSLTNSITESIIDESIDFKVVDFRFAEEAISVFSSIGNMEFVKEHSMHIMTVKKHNGDHEKYLGLFKVGNKFSIYQSYGTLGNFIRFSDFLSILREYSRDNTIKTTNNEYVALSHLIESFKKVSGFTDNISKEQRQFYSTIIRLQDNIDRMVYSQEIEETATYRIVDELDKIKDSIKLGFINWYLSKYYNDEFIKVINETKLDAIGQSKKIIELIPNRLYNGVSHRVNKVDNVELIGFIAII